MMPNTYGYVRVSTKDQNEARQLAALACYEIPPQNLFLDKLSGKDFNRPAYRRLLRRLRPGDLLIVKSIDRLGRNYNEILEQWRLITKEKRSDILIVDMPLLDTRARGQDLTGAFIADLVLQILSYVAETERTNIRQRQAEGIAAAKARGVQFGRARLSMPPAFTEAAAQCDAGLVSINRAAKLAGMSYGTFYRRYQERELQVKPLVIEHGCK